MSFEFKTSLEDNSAVSTNLQRGINLANYGSLAEAITAIGVSSVDLFIPSGTHTVADNLTVPSNVNLVFENGGLLSVDSGKVLTINGKILAGLYQIFSGSGSVAGTPIIDCAYPEWFGLTMNSSGSAATNVTAINKAFAISNNLRVLSKGTLYLASKVSIPASKSLVLSVGITIIPTVLSIDIFEINQYSRLENVWVDVNDLGFTGSIVSFVSAASSSYSTLRNIRAVSDFTKDMQSGKGLKFDFPISNGSRCAYGDFTELRFTGFEYGIYINCDAAMANYVNANKFQGFMVGCKYAVYANYADSNFYEINGQAALLTDTTIPAIYINGHANAGCLNIFDIGLGTGVQGQLLDLRGYDNDFKTPAYNQKCISIQKPASNKVSTVNRVTVSPKAGYNTGYNGTQDNFLTGATKRFTVTPTFTNVSTDSGHSISELFESRLSTKFYSLMYANPLVSTDNAIIEIDFGSTQILSVMGVTTKHNSHCLKIIMGVYDSYDSTWHYRTFLPNEGGQVSWVVSEELNYSIYSTVTKISFQFFEPYDTSNRLVKIASLFAATQDGGYGYLPTEGGTLYGNLTYNLGTYAEAHPVIGINHLWLDTNGYLRIKDSTPVREKDGKLLVRNKQFEIFDDFIAATPNTQYLALKGTDGDAVVPTIVTGAERGVLRFVTGNNSGTLSEDGSQYIVNIPVQADSGGLSAEAILKINTAITGVSVNFGLTDSTSLEEPFTIATDDVITSNASDAACFVYDADSTTKTWFYCAVDSNVDDIYAGKAGDLSIDTCDDAWNQQTIANVTASIDSSDKVYGSNSIRFQIADGFGTGIVATEAITSVNLSGYTHISFWFKSDVALDSGDYQILIDNTANCASPLETLNVPAIPANTWTFCQVAFVTPSNLTAVICLGLNQVVDKGVVDIHIDGVKAHSATAYAPVADTYQKLRIDIPDTTGNSVYYYINDVLVGTATWVGVSPDVNLYATVIANSTTNSSKTVDVDYIYIAHNR